MTQPDSTIWAVIFALGLGTFLIRFSFLGLIGGRKLPALVLRLLRYTPVAIFPGIALPLVLWPEATGGTPEPARIAAALATLAAGWATKNVLAGIGAGGAVLALGLWLLPG